MQHPFQCLAIAKPPGALGTFLLAACGTKLVTVSLDDNASLFQWTATPTAVEPQSGEAENAGRPAKRQKTNPAPATNIIKLTISPDNQHAVIVNEDKLVRVFQILEDGALVELSQRAMPKRPCAIEVLPDNATIICGDKFGDVYSLPLLPAEQMENLEATAGAPDESEKQPQTFKPSASNTTVHTKRNRKALEAQLKQKSLTPKTKEPLKFEHRLLLGHVSMLTDLTFATREVQGKQRGYIITADRDEHIRVSRGPPQCHIIEGYCLGHTKFVSKVCLIPTTNLLVSGGGDDWLGVWEWPSFKLVNKLDLLPALREGLEQRSARLKDTAPTIENVSVSGIWVVPIQSGDQAESAVVVACEGHSILLVCSVPELQTRTASFHAVSSFDMQTLDIVHSGNIVIATLDDRGNENQRVQAFRLARNESDGIDFLQDGALSKSRQALNTVEHDLKNEKTLDSLLYGVANLRKRGHQNDEETGEATAEPDDAD